ncbi:MAG: sigma-54-dependent Fis family transcriptional regulator [Deltaproteobacteria bacterium]|nr:sigma-54-dependent Fis family transcriptional regulator [Deltaproteobacteria bacterium]MBW2445074.1 sigma-54-dependent Fis family transcriptional regulator [Deltaproteobacteria bacterium]
MAASSFQSREEAGEAARAREEAAAPGRVLLVDDEPLLLRSLARILRAEGHEVLSAASVAEAERHLGDPRLDVALVDLFLGSEDGLELLGRVKDARPELELVMMTGHATVETAVGAMRRGAFDYLAKPFDDPHRVSTTVWKALERRRLVRRNRDLEDELRGRQGGGELVGRSPGMRALHRTLQSLRHNQSVVLIRGESGTGKELVARALHRASPRADGPFVPVDCGALPVTIIESELFGHEPGAFTDARGAPGLFRMAAGGTLLLDEVGELPAEVQAKLLRALQAKAIRPVGGTRELPVDLRVVSATHRDLDEMVAEGSFRLDLLYRLAVVQIEIPPLRQRREDIPLLAHHFLGKHAGGGEVEDPVAGLDDDALEALVAYDWPGNVRELENVIESALALARGPRLRRGDLRLPLQRATSGAAHELPLSLDAYERSALERALAECGGDVGLAARRLGLGRSTFYRKLAKHGLEPQGFRIGLDAASELIS